MMADNRKRINEENEERKKGRELNNEIIGKLYCNKSNTGKNPIIVNYLDELKHNFSEISKKPDNERSKYLHSQYTLNATEVIDRYINNFVDIVGIYIKIEWDRAKNNEDPNL